MSISSFASEISNYESELDQNANRLMALLDQSSFVDGSAPNSVSETSLRKGSEKLTNLLIDAIGGILEVHK